MSITKEQILEAIAKMSILDVIEMVSMMEKKFGISSSNITDFSISSVENTSEKKKEEKTEFNVVLNKIGTNKIAVIKAVRSVVELGLKETKDLVESAPVTIKEKISKEEAENLCKSLKEAGAVAEVI